MNAVSIIGAGRLGTVLGRALAGRGFRIDAVYCRSLGSARESAAIIGAGRPTCSLRRAARTAGLVFITAPDRAVAEIAEALSRLPVHWAERCVFHASGLLPAETLAPLRARGAAVAAIHPAQSFPAKDASPDLFRGISWGLEGDEAAVAAARALVKKLRGRALLLCAEDKPLYHAACCLASNGTAILMEAASGLLEQAGFSADSIDGLLRPLVEGTLRNVKNLGAVRALTGPLVRGDEATIAKHLEALAGRPADRGIYRALANRARASRSSGGAPAGALRARRTRPGGK